MTAVCLPQLTGRVERRWGVQPERSATPVWRGNVAAKPRRSVPVFGASMWKLAARVVRLLCSADRRRTTAKNRGTSMAIAAIAFTFPGLRPHPS